MPFLIKVTPDPDQLAAAKRQGAQEALAALLASMRGQLNTRTMPNLNTTTSSAFGSDLACFCNSLIHQAQQASEKIEFLEGSCQRAYGEIRALQASHEAQQLEIMQQKIIALREQLDVITRERDQARQLNHHQAEQIDKLNQTIVHVNEQLGELVKSCRLFYGTIFRSRPRVTRVIGYIG